MRRKSNNPVWIDRGKLFGAILSYKNGQDIEVSAETIKNIISELINSIAGVYTKLPNGNLMLSRPIDLDDIVGIILYRFFTLTLKKIDMDKIDGNVNRCYYYILRGIKMEIRSIRQGEARYRNNNPLCGDYHYDADNECRLTTLINQNDIENAIDSKITVYQILAENKHEFSDTLQSVIDYVIRFQDVTPIMNAHIFKDRFNMCKSELSYFLNKLKKICCKRYKGMVLW